MNSVWQSLHSQVLTSPTMTLIIAGPLQIIAPLMPINHWQDDACYEPDKRASRSLV
jgi:hypothetical protein